MDEVDNQGRLVVVDSCDTVLLTSTTPTTCPPSTLVWLPGGRTLNQNHVHWQVGD